MPLCLIAIKLVPTLVTNLVPIFATREKCRLKECGPIILKELGGLCRRKDNFWGISIMSSDYHLSKVSSIMLRRVIEIPKISFELKI